ncbi:MAG: polysaccharide biosynthesis/export family protein [Rikenellaceae bacterium]
MKKNIHILLLLFFVTISCMSTKEVLYLQDTSDYVGQKIEAPLLTIQPNDLLDIVVTCPTPELAAPFNDYGINTGVAGQRGVSGGSVGTRQQYIVDEQGDIVFPILGPLHVQGLTSIQISDMISNTIKEEGYIQDPSVSTKITNFRISVMGSVKMPGVYNVADQKITIFEALSKAGDLDIQGKRYNITIVREINGFRAIGRLDIRSKEIFESPYYYLQQNDIIYVEPNKAKINSGSDRQIAMLSAQLTTVLVSVASLIVTLTR